MRIDPKSKSCEHLSDVGDGMLAKPRCHLGKCRRKHLRAGRSCLHGPGSNAHTGMGVEYDELFGVREQQKSAIEDDLGGN